MRALIAVLVLLSFFQASLLSFDIVIVAITVRSFLIHSQAEQGVNLWLAFSLGLLVSILTAQPLGLVSLIYLISVVLVNLAKNSQLTNSWLAIIPLVCLASAIAQLSHQSFSVQVLIYQLISLIPVYLALKLWEERFVIPERIRLKI